MMSLERITVPGHGPHYITGKQQLADNRVRLALVPCHSTGVFRAVLEQDGTVTDYKQVHRRERAAVAQTGGEAR
jgi:hypothetical protein